MSEAVLSVEGVSKTYPGVRALADVSLDVRAGEVHAIVGENGSGKSTLMKIISGAVTPDAGTVDIGGVRLSDADPRKARRLGLATVYQDDSLVRELTVAQNLLLGTTRGEIKFPRHRDWAKAVLERYELAIRPETPVGELTPAERQFVEIIKALLSTPKVLLLDEPTSTLDTDGVRKLSVLVRDLAARGAGILYVSHRLPEVLDLSRRISILRDGVHRGTFDVTPELSEEKLVNLMVGRDLDSDYPPKRSVDAADVPILAVRNLSGAQFSGLSFTAREGEIIGFAGAEGNGQREALRAVAGLAPSSGAVDVKGRAADLRSPRKAIGDGVLFLSADRVGEAVFPDLGVGMNMTITRLGEFLRGGFLFSRAEKAAAAQMEGDFNVVAASLDVPIASLSGGNQQKAALARSFRSGASAILIDEPTQGVDAAARFEIYGAIRQNIASGRTCVVNSSDAQELAGICDRVLVFSRGRVVQELSGDEITEERIVGSFLTHRGDKTADATAGAGGGLLRALISGATIWWAPMLFLAALVLVVGVYAALQKPVFLKPINLQHILLAAAPAILVAMAQLQVLLVRGLDISVGSLMSVTVVAASFLIGAGTPLPMIVLGALACAAIGLAAGYFNGILVRGAKISAIITTIAMLSILQGIALVARPIPKGTIEQGFVDILRTKVGFLPLSFLVLIALAIAGDYWLHRTRSGLEARAVGFREEAALRNGVRVDFIQIRAYALAGLLSAVAGLFLASEVGVGHPTVGQNYALSSIAAAVLGGAALTGGRGAFGGALMGALFFTVTINVISILGLSASVGVIASGIMTLLAIFLYSGVAEIDRIVDGLRRTFAARQGNT